MSASVGLSNPIKRPEKVETPQSIRSKKIISNESQTSETVRFEKRWKFCLFLRWKLTFARHDFIYSPFFDLTKTKRFFFNAFFISSREPWSTFMYRSLKLHRRRFPWRKIRIQQFQFEKSEKKTILNKSKNFSLSSEFSVIQEAERHDPRKGRFKRQQRQVN